MVASSGVPTQSGPVEKLREFRRDMSPTQWLQTKLMFASIVLLHVIGFGVFFIFVVPGHYKGLGIGVSVLAYTLGLRHAFDADHISAIDNTTRKLMNEGKKPLSVGYFFSLGHSTIVIAIGAGIVIAEKAVYGAVSNNGSGLEQFGGIFGTVVSAGFLYLIAFLNIVILAGIIAVFRKMRHGDYDEAELEKQLENRGFMFRIFGPWMKTITKEWQMYPVGVVFGMGFDTATEVALLATTALLATQALPWYSIMCLPILFTAGMSLMDTFDGVFMNVAYGWAFFNPVRKVYYNLAITGLSVFICFFIGTIEVLGLLPMETPPQRQLLELHGQLRHQQGRLRDRGDVRRDLGGRPFDLEVRSHRGEVDGQAQSHDGCGPVRRGPRAPVRGRCRRWADVAPLCLIET